MSIQQKRPDISWMVVVLVLLTTFVAYIPVYSAGFIWDDDAYVVDNPVYAMQNPLREIWTNPTSTPQFYPLVFTIFHFQRKLWGLDPFGYHLINVLIHAGSALLLWRVLLKLRVPGALLAMAVFAVHPIMVESVAWVTELKNTLSSFMFLASLMAFLKFSMPGEKAAPVAGGPSPARWAWYAAALCFYILALLSKTVASGLAPVLVLLIWWKRLPRQYYLATIPYFVFGLVGGLFTAYLERTHVGAAGAAWHISFPEKIVLAGQILWFYIYKLLLPLDLRFYYPRWTLNAASPLQWIFSLAALGLVAFFWFRREKLGRAPFAAAVAFVALLFPALGFFALFPMIFSWVADHFAYLATLVFIPAVCAALVLAARRFKLPQAVGVTIAVAVLGGFANKTGRVAKHYHSPETLWMSVLNADPERPHWNALSGMSDVKHKLADERRKQGRREEALALNEEARVFDEKALAMRPGYAGAHYGLAVYHDFRGDSVSALAQLSKAIEIDPYDPRPHALRATILHSAGRLEEARAAAAQAVNILPGRVSYLLLYASIQMDLGADALAEQALFTALSLDVRNSATHLLRGTFLARKGQLPDALQSFKAAVLLDPSNLEAHDSFARVVSILPTATPAEVNEALERAKTIVEGTQRNNPAYLDTLAMVYHRMGDDTQALALLTEALTSKAPMDPVVRGNLLRHWNAWANGQPPPVP